MKCAFGDAFDNDLSVCTHDLEYGIFFDIEHMMLIYTIYKTERIMFGLTMHVRSITWFFVGVFVIAWSK